MRIINAIAVLLGIFTLGFFSMGFQLVGSRLLAPHFGSSIIVWAFLISTFLAAFSVGSFFGGWVSGLPPARKRTAVWTIVGAQLAGLGFTAWLGKGFLRLVEGGIESITFGLLIASPALFFVPVMMLSAFLPLATETLARGGLSAGVASGLSYGISTTGNIAGVMGTAFILIPNFRISHLLIAWFVCIAPILFFLASRFTRAER